MTLNKKLLPLLFIFPVLFILVSAQPIQMQQQQMVSATSSEDDDQNSQSSSSTAAGGQGIAVGEPDPSAPIPTEPNDGTGSQDQCDPEEEDCGTPIPGPPPGFPQPSGTNDARSGQVGGIGAGQINQNAQGEVNRQLCSTIGGIGNRECQQQATPGADNLQSCTAIAGLGKANCVQSENPSGPDTCLTANGRPFICETSTGTSLSGSGQAGTGR